MKDIEKIKEFLNENHKVYLGYSEIEFFNYNKLDEEQMGYQEDVNPESPNLHQNGDWMKEWIVIGTDGLGDPIFVDSNHPNLPVMTSMHGEGEWIPSVIAESFDEFKNIILKLKRLSLGRTNPVELEENPLSKKEGKQFIKDIEKNNPNIDIDFWESFLEDE